MPLVIKTRQNYVLKVELCGVTSMPSLFCVLRPLTSSGVSFNVGDGQPGSYPTITPAFSEQSFSILESPFLTARDAYVGTVNTSKALYVGSGSPLCQQAIAGGTVTLRAYEQLYASSTESSGKSVISVAFSQGVAFSQAQSVSLLPPDCVFGNSPSLYEVVIFSGNYSTPKIWYSDFLSIEIQGAAASSSTNPPANCGVLFSAESSIPSQTSTGMLGSGGGT